MALTPQLRDALIKHAHELLGRPLGPAEVESIVDAFNKATGTDEERALKSLRKFENEHRPSDAPSAKQPAEIPNGSQGEEDGDDSHEEEVHHEDSDDDDLDDDFDSYGASDDLDRGMDDLGSEIDDQ